MIESILEKIQEEIKQQQYNDIAYRATRIYNAGRYSIESLELKGKGVAILKVQSESGNGRYTVSIENLNGDELEGSCTCPYDWGDICKHQLAALMALKNHLNTIAIKQPIEHKMLESIAYLPNLDEAKLKLNSLEADFKLGKNVKLVTILKALNGVAEVKITYKKDTFDLRFEQIDKNSLKTFCSCAETLTKPLCKHKIGALITIRDKFGLRAFEMMKDWDEEKNKALAPYGFSIKDDLKNKFDFKISNDAKLTLIVQDKAIHPIQKVEKWTKIQKNIAKPSLSDTFLTPAVEEKKSAKNTVRELFYAFVFHPDKFRLPDMLLLPMVRQHNLKTGKISQESRLDRIQFDNLPPIDREDSQLIKQTSLLKTDNLLKILRNNGFIVQGWFYEDFPISALNDTGFQYLQEYVGNLLETFLPILQQKNIAIQQVITGVPYYYSIEISSKSLRPSFQLTEDDLFFKLNLFIHLDGKNIAFDKFEKLSFWLLKFDGKLFKIRDLADANALAYFAEVGAIKVKKENFSVFYHDFVEPLAQNFEVDIALDRPMVHIPLEWIEARVFFKEDDNNLLLIPTFHYKYQNGELEFLQDGKSAQISENDGNLLFLERNSEMEQEIYEFVCSLHPDFNFQEGKHFFYLPFEDVLKNQWFFDAFEKLKERNIPVFGHNNLKKLRYNPNKANMQIRTSSGIDWFDMKMEISFGEQFASLSDVRKAILKKQNYVELKDGSWGVLPEEWIEKYAALFKFGNVDGDELKVSKLHFSLIDELYMQIDNAEVQKELFEKKQKLLNFKEIADIALPSNVKATLRDYQAEGFKWLNFLDEFRFGGCLADDMGLGKTLQALTFLQDQKNKFPASVNLIVMPTTLIFNWLAEADKFCPDLKVFVYRGMGREKNNDYFKNYDLILTTYGTLRQDIEIFKAFEFHYIVLDESQAIKNPNAQISKAVKLLKARNRFVMTGTPIENNTFDLYSQMEFVNPGLLGNQEFFKEEYANAIDKHRDEGRAKELRKLIYPFMLKRTKEEVAKDLPDKTETILYCEMGKKQRKVYDTMRETYRQKIADKMSIEGKEKSSFLILEGLLKLRQICDSPALLNDEADYGTESAKLDEIVREIEENASNHKILIFSQFLKMLDLIRVELDRLQIGYQYLDGQTTDRAARVNAFQKGDNFRVFLMSLKAGGVGINLTQADYVYLIDPWWNPAVEAQAIDRTHRIGQTRKVFAYKMICKDTIEEKIITLQEKKREVAQDIIHIEAGFIKKLDQNDILELFS